MHMLFPSMRLRFPANSQVQVCKLSEGKHNNKYYIKNCTALHLEMVTTYTTYFSSRSWITTGNPNNSKFGKRKNRTNWTKTAHFEQPKVKAEGHILYHQLHQHMAPQRGYQPAAATPFTKLPTWITRVCSCTVDSSGCVVCEMMICWYLRVAAPDRTHLSNSTHEYYSD